MPLLEFALPCLLTSIDQRSNALSLFHVVESLEVVQRPNETPDEAWARALPALEVVTLWRRSDSDRGGDLYEQVVFVDRPDGTAVVASEVVFRIPHLRHRIQVQLPPLGGITEGQLVIRIHLNQHGKPLTAEPVSLYPIRVDFTTLPIVITLEPAELEYLQKPVRGQGGFQSLLRRIQGQIAGNNLSLSVSDGERLIKYANDYGGGGFQNRLGRVVEQIREQLE